MFHGVVATLKLFHYEELSRKSQAPERALHNYTGLYLLLIIISSSTISSCSKPNNNYYTWVDKAALREGASLNAKVISYLDQGDDVVFTGEKSPHTTKVVLRNQEYNAYWLRVKTTSGLIGWIHSATLKNYAELLKLVEDEKEGVGGVGEYEYLLIPLLKGSSREFEKAAATIKIPKTKGLVNLDKTFPQLMSQFEGYTDNPVIINILKQKVREYYKPVDDYFHSVPQSASGQTLMCEGPVLASLDDGDYYLPRFSPDGKYLAYAKTLKRRGTVVGAQGEAEYYTGELLLRDCTSMKQVVCLGAETVSKYRAYSATFITINWLSPDLLGTTVFDGDVDGQDLTVDITSNKIIKSEHDSLGFNSHNRELKKLQDAVRPHVPDGTAFPVSENYCNELLPDAFLFQGDDYEGGRNKLSMLEFSTKKFKTLVTLPEVFNGNFCGGSKVGGDYLLAFTDAYISYEKKYVLRYHADKLQSVLLSVSCADQFPRFKEIKKLRNGLLFAFFDGPENTVYYLYREGRLFEVVDFPNINYIDFSPDGTTAAFCYKQQKESCARTITLKKI